MQGRNAWKILVHDIGGYYYGLQLRPIKKRLYVVKRDCSEQPPVIIDDVDMLELVLDKVLGNLREGCVLG